MSAILAYNKKLPFLISLHATPLNISNESSNDTVINRQKLFVYATVIQ